MHAAAGLKYAASKDMAVMIMEPLRGGNLAKTPPPSVQGIWSKADHKKTPVAWHHLWSGTQVKGKNESTPAAPKTARRWLRRGPWEMASTVVIAIGVVMLMQPFWLPLFTYSFITILVGTIMFVVVSHFRE